MSPPHHAPADPSDLAPLVQQWTRVHAVLLLCASAASLGLGGLHPLFVIGIPSFAWLGRRTAGSWTPSGLPGIANLITALRLSLAPAIAALIGVLGPVAAVPMALLFLTLDGIDGAVARHYGEAGLFGETFDKETDAFFVLVLCFLLFELERLPYWILSVGLLRYLFVLWMWRVRGPATRERRSRFARISYVVAVSSLLVAFLPAPALYRPLALLATGLLFVSFARSALWTLRPH